MPLKRPFSTSRHTTTQSSNILLTFEVDGVTGIGEAVPRGKLTGDLRPKNWRLTRVLLGLCAGAELDASSRERALASVASLMARLRRRAARSAEDINREKPFRGLLSGFEIALLDVAARLRGETVAELLGVQRDQVFATATTSSTHHSEAELVDSFTKHRQRYRAYRCKGAADLDANIARLEAMRRVDHAVGSEAVHWLDLNEAMTSEQAHVFVERLIDMLEVSGSRDSRIILEQPVPKSETAALVALQAVANARLSPEHGRILIMADESLWDLEDYKQIVTLGGCGAINIKIPKVGGLLPALELARYAAQHTPETEIYIGGMIGTSDITARAVYNLVAALPRVDHCTTSPAMNVQANMAESMIAFEGPDSARVLLGDSPGLGTGINQEALRTYLVRQAERVAESGLSSLADNVYDEPQLAGFDQKGLDSHLIERECLQRGLAVVRTSPLEFRVRDEAGKELEFFWSYVPRLPLETRVFCRKKYLTKALFSSAGVPVAEGKCFTVRDRKSAVAYAHSLGWPVVVKPGVGTGGLGVTANINSDEELAWALDQLVENETARKRNDGFCIIERHVPGIELRVMVVDGQVVSAIQKLQASVTGDGVHTVAQLVESRRKARAGNPRLRNSSVSLKEKAIFQLRRQGLELDSIPEKGRHVLLSLVASISQGADTRSVHEALHPSVKKACVDAVRSVPGLNFAGVDILLEDYQRDLVNQAAAVCEVNTTPSYSAAHFPALGTPINVASRIVEMYLTQYGLASGVRTEGQMAAQIRCQRISASRELVGWFRQRAAEFGLRGACTRVSATEVVLKVKGDAAKVSALSSLCVRPPGPKNAKATVATTVVAAEDVPDRVFPS